MSDYSAGQGDRLTESRVFPGDTVSRAYMNAALEEARRRVGELSNETISGREMLGGYPDRGGTVKRGGGSQRSSTPGLDEAFSGKAPGLSALAL